MKHTPTPWRRNIRPVTKYPIVFAGHAPAHSYCFSFHVPREVSLEQAEANLDFILRACNSHEELVAALESALGEIEQLYCELRGATSWSIDNPEQRSDCMNEVLAALKLANEE